MSKEQSEAYKEMAKKDDTIYYREIDKEAFLYLNFRKYPKPTEEEITKAFQVECQVRKERVDLLKQQELPEDVKLYQEMEGQESTEEEKDTNKQEKDLSGSILDCMELLSYNFKQRTKGNHYREPGKRTDRRAGETPDVLSGRKDVSVSKSIFATE